MPRGIVWNWDTIKEFGSAKALKSSYFFLFLVPIIARMLMTAPEKVSIPLWKESIQVHLSLPFSWTVLFFSACFASVGNIAYELSCPLLIKQFTDYTSFKASERDGTYFRSIVKELALVPTETTIIGQLISLRNIYNNIPVDFNHLEGCLNGTSDVSAQDFYFIRDAANFGKPLGRLVASLRLFRRFLLPRNNCTSESCLCSHVLQSYSIHW